MTVRLLRALATAVLASLTSLALQAASPGDAARDASSCVSVRTTAAGTTEVSNQCEQRVSIAYCSTARPISKKRCGEQPSQDNPYYTHSTTVEAGTRAVIGQPRDSLRMAACLGGLRKFRSGLDGNYSCTQDANEQLAYVHAIGPTEVAACESAREHAGAQATKAPCKCEVAARKGDMVAYHCAAPASMSLEEARAKEGFVEDVKGWVGRIVGRCGPKDMCRSGTGIAIGVRG